MGTETGEAEFGPNHAAVAEFVDCVRRLEDEGRLAVAEARKAVDETFHEKALRAASEALPGRGEAYARARRRVAGAHVPDRLASDDAPRRDEAARWSEVARLVQLAIDETLVAFVASDHLHPNHLRELCRPWKALIAEAAPVTPAKRA